MYSIEEICDAMITAGSAATSCRTEREFLFCALQSAGDLLDVSCCAFYPASPAFDHIGTVRANHRAAVDLEIPERLPPTFSDYLRKQIRRLVVSREWDALGTLLPQFDFTCCSSVWIGIGNDERTLGTLACFDHPSRTFDRTQQKIIELIGTVVAIGLEFQIARHAGQGAESAAYHEFSKLANSIARDLINPLSAIFGYVELLKAEPVGERPTHLVSRLEEQVEKARRVITTFSNGQRAGSSGLESVPAAPAQIESVAAMTPAKREETAVQRVHQTMNPDESPNARILLVQRNEAVFEFQRSVLNALGAEIIPAFSCSDALDQLRARELDAIILDDELEEPVASKRLVTWVRENRPELSDRILLTVSRKPSQETREILETAMLPHVTKPIEVLELYSRAQQVLQSGKNPHLLQ